MEIRKEAVVRDKAIYLALGVLHRGSGDMLSFWAQNTEETEFWMEVFNDLKTRSGADSLIAITDGLQGIPDALGAAFPTTTLQTCLVHPIRNCLNYASWRERKPLAAALKRI